MIVKDSMVMIHLAKITLLEKSCEYFKNVVIPKLVYDEILLGKEKGYPDVNVIVDLVETKKIVVKQVKNKSLIKKAVEFNIQRGEAEAVALYWQEKADYLATDDDNVRKKSVLLNIKIIGTPAIILKLYKERLIKKEEFEESLAELKKIGWFSNAVIDKILMEGLK
jgi:predicted nucleic acid-binding protein